MAEDTATPASEARYALKQLGDAARQESAALNARLKELAEGQKAWDAMLSYLERGWHLHLLKRFDEITPRLRRMRDEGHPLIPPIDAAYRHAKEEASALFRRFPAVLHQALQAEGITIDPDSRHPRYTLRSRFLLLDIDDQLRMARISTTEGQIAEMAADVEAIVQRLKSEISRLFERKFNGTALHRAIRKQYLAAVKSLKQPDGAGVPIRQIMQRMVKRSKAYRRDELLVDLACLVNEGPLVHGGYRLDLQQTRDTKEGVLLAGDAGRGYVGFIIFQREAT